MRTHADNTDVVLPPQRLVSETIPAPDLTTSADVPNLPFGEHPVTRVRNAHLCTWPCVNRGGHKGRTHRRVGCGCSLLFHPARSRYVACLSCEMTAAMSLVVKMPAYQFVSFLHAPRPALASVVLVLRTPYLLGISTPFKDEGQRAHVCRPAPCTTCTKYDIRHINMARRFGIHQGMDPYIRVEIKAATAWPGRSRTKTGGGPSPQPVGKQSDPLSPNGGNGSRYLQCLHAPQPPQPPAARVGA
ncbi:hypothetical protein J3F83DRAFT_173360 [Trichoderma novae-zelandiae]